MPEQPKQLGAAPKEPVIYTIPDQFYGLAAKAQLPKEAIARPMPGAPAAPAPVPVPGEPSVPPPAKESKAWILIPIWAVLFLVGAGFAAWWFLRPKKPAATTQPTVTLPTTPQTQPEPEPTPEPEPEPTPEPATTTEEVPPPSPSADEDGDGLTTAEETLFGTDAKKSDSDGDGFSDSVEVMNLYNPAGFRPTKLIEAGLVKEHVAVSGTFQLLYPSTWVIGPASQTDGADFTDAVTSAVFAVAVQDNPNQQALLDWYMSRNPGAAPSEIQQFTTKTGLEGIRVPSGPDTLTAYIDLGGGAIYKLSYATGSQGMIYASTFTMFLNSFAKKP